MATARPLVLRPTPWFLAAAFLTLVLAPAAHAAETAQLQVVLADPAIGGTSGRMARLDVEVTADLTVRTDDDGAHIRLPMPQVVAPSTDLAAMDLHFFAPEGGATDGNYEVVTVNQTQHHAVFRWHRAAPEAGATVGVTLEATRTVSLAEMVTIIWPSHGHDNVTVRLDLPATHTLQAAGHGDDALDPAEAADGRNAWNGTVSAPSVAMVFRPTSAIPGDPFETYRPTPLAGWLIVIGLGVVSGGAWVLGKRLEPRPEETEEDAGDEGDDVVAEPGSEGSTPGGDRTEETR